MRKRDREPLRLIGLKVPASMAAEISRRAKVDDRTLSGFLRRLIAAGLRRFADEQGQGDDTGA